MTKIGQIVKDLQGCKATELAVILAQNGIKDIFSAIAEAKEAKEIIEIEYILPTMIWRIKSFYLPQDTKIVIK